jgi:hypothetical protein
MGARAFEEAHPHGRQHADPIDRRGDLEKGLRPQVFPPREIRIAAQRARRICHDDGNMGASAGVQKEWISVENPKAAGLVKRWWQQHGGLDPIPTTVSDALGRVAELRPVDEIRIEAAGKFWRISGRRFAEGAADPAEAAQAATRPRRPSPQRAGSTYARTPRLTAARHAAETARAQAARRNGGYAAGRTGPGVQAGAQAAFDIRSRRRRPF